MITFFHDELSSSSSSRVAIDAPLIVQYYWHYWAYCTVY